VAFRLVSRRHQVMHPQRFSPWSLAVGFLSLFRLRKDFEIFE
jgi:hypothetical protein